MSWTQLWEDMKSAVSEETTQAWLLGPTQNEKVNAGLHWAAITASGAVSTFLNPLSSWRAPGLDDIGSISIGASRAINTLITTLLLPNIEGIPIQADTQTCSRDVDISELMLIGQGGNAHGKQYVTDNTAPRPREWRLTGYLMPLVDWVDSYLLVKPTLAAQIGLLDRYATARAPVWFKPYYNLFEQVLISNFTYDFEPDKLNGVRVSLTLREFVPFEAESTIVSLLGKVI